MSSELKSNKEFLNKQLELWKNKISKRKKWIDNIHSYKQSVVNVQEYLINIEESLADILFDDDNFVSMKNQSNNNKTEFLSYLNNENINHFLNIDYFKSVQSSYKNTYWGKQVIEKSKVFNENNLNTKTLNNLSNGKGPLILYILIEHLNNLHNDDIRDNLIRFYDNAIKLFRTPHSASSRMGLHFEVCNNNFITNIKDFFQSAKDKNYKNTLNATYPYRSKEQSTFHLYSNENVAIELFGWINLGEQIDNDKVIAIYNNKITKSLKLLMNEDKLAEDIDTFYKLYFKYVENKKPYPDSSLDNLEKVLYADQFFQYIHELEIEQLHKNIIYYGAPGTGKTYHFKEFFKFNNINDTNFKIVQFHPSYGYEDFIEGVKPKGIDADSGNIKFELVNGEFKQFCIDASKKSNEEFYFIVDEINRAELSRTFGELLYCFEYRIEFEENGSIDFNKNKTNFIRTQYSSLIDSLDNKADLSLIVHDNKSYFGIPENVYFIGTMNDIDKSIDSFDMALRRRFVWKRMDCDYEVVKEWLYEKNIDNEVSVQYIDKCKKLNSYISDDLSLGTSYQIGHAYFMNLSLEEDSETIKDTMLNELWKNKIEPLLHEYLRAEYNDKEIEDKLIIAKEKFTLKDTE
jgi:hypothetical protein